MEVNPGARIFRLMHGECAEGVTPQNAWNTRCSPPPPPHIDPVSPRFIASKFQLDDSNTGPLATRTLTMLVGVLTNTICKVAFLTLTAIRAKLGSEGAGAHVR